MNHSKTQFFLILLVAFQLISVLGISQNKVSSHSVNLKLLVAAREIMIDAGTCALITLDDEGKSRARTMDALIPEDDFTVWFGTNSSSRKVAQIKNDPRVTLYYFDTKTQGYVVIAGIAQLITDSTLKEKYWKEEWEAFYPNKQKDFMLIKVSPQWLEILSPAHGIYNNPVTWQPPVVIFD